MAQAIGTPSSLSATMNQLTNIMTHCRRTRITSTVQSTRCPPTQSGLSSGASWTRVLTFTHLMVAQNTSSDGFHQTHCRCRSCAMRMGRSYLPGAACTGAGAIFTRGRRLCCTSTQGMYLAFLPFLSFPFYSHVCVQEKKESGGWGNGDHLPLMLAHTGQLTVLPWCDPPRLERGTSLFPAISC